MHSPTSSTSSTASLNALLAAEDSDQLVLPRMTAHRVFYGRNVIQVPLKQPATNESVNLVLSQLEFDTMAVHVPHYEDLPPEELLERITERITEQASKRYQRLGTSASISSNEQADSLAAFQSRLLELEYERKRLDSKWKEARALQMSLTHDNTALREQVEEAAQREVDMAKLVHANELLRYQTLQIETDVLKYKAVATRTVQELKRLQQHLAALKDQVLDEHKEVTTTVQTGLTRMKDEVQRREAELQHSYRTEKSARESLAEKYYELSGRIRVFCRVRPGRTTETPALVLPRPNHLVLTSSGKEFAFDQVFGPQSTQREVYAQVGPLIASFTDGYNACLLAYGQTGSGKTHTMVGPTHEQVDDRGDGWTIPATAGMIPRALQHVFDLVQTRQVTYHDVLRVSMVEIYNDQILDLLHASNAETGKNAVAKPETELTARDVDSFRQVDAVMRDGNAHRNVAATKMNVESSRSHALVFLHLESQHRETREVRKSTLCLVDLAGSERISRSQVEGDRLRETQHINKSLAALGDVVYALQHKAKHTPYRNSKLTYMLRDMLSGQAKTLLMLQLSPDAADVQETTCSLEFGARVSQVQMGAVKPSVETGALFKLQEDNRVLEAKTQAMEAQLKELQQHCRQQKSELHEAHSSNEALKRQLWLLNGCQCDNKTLEEPARGDFAQKASSLPLAWPSSPTPPTKSGRSVASTPALSSQRSQDSPLSVLPPASTGANLSPAVLQHHNLDSMDKLDERHEASMSSDKAADPNLRRKSLSAPSCANRSTVHEHRRKSLSPLQARSLSGVAPPRPPRRKEVVSPENRVPLHPSKAAGASTAPASARQKVSASWLSRSRSAHTLISSEPSTFSPSPTTSTKSKAARTLHQAASSPSRTPSRTPTKSPSRVASAPAKTGTESRRASLKNTRSLSSTLGTSARRALASSHTGFEWT